MGMTEYEKARELIRSNAKAAHFAGARPETLIQTAEAALSLHFSPSYRAFLRDFGAGNFGSFEVYGLIDDDFENSSVPDAIWFTLTERREAGLPSELLVIGDAGTGELYCLRTAKDDADGCVILLDTGSPAPLDQCEQISVDFGCYLLEHVERQLRR